MPNVIRKRFYLHPEKDPDILEWLSEIPANGQSSAIRDAIRRGISRTDADNFAEKVRAVIQEELRAASFTVHQAAPVNAEPKLEDPEVTDLIDGLLGWGE